MHPRPPRRIGANIIIPFLLIAVVFGGLFWQKYQATRIMPTVPPCKQETEVKTVVLFFANSQNRLDREARELDNCGSKETCLRSLVDALISGPISELDRILPDRTELLKATITGDTAILDFSSDFKNDLPSGSAAEMNAIYSLVDTICTNMPEVKQVKIQIDGNPKSRLRHLDLRDTIRPDYSLVAPSHP